LGKEARKQRSGREDEKSQNWKGGGSPKRLRPGPSILIAITLAGPIKNDSEVTGARRPCANNRGRVKRDLAHAGGKGKKSGARQPRGDSGGSARLLPEIASIYSVTPERETVLFTKKGNFYAKKIESKKQELLRREEGGGKFKFDGGNGGADSSGQSHIDERGASCRFIGGGEGTKSRLMLRHVKSKRRRGRPRRGRSVDWPGELCLSAASNLFKRSPLYERLSDLEGLCAVWKKRRGRNQIKRGVAPKVTAGSGIAVVVGRQKNAEKKRKGH